jgi:hypothetical protein
MAKFRDEGIINGLQQRNSMFQGLDPASRVEVEKSMGAGSGKQRMQHKYISRKWVDGKWEYEYEGDKGGRKPNADSEQEKPAEKDGPEKVLSEAEIASDWKKYFKRKESVALMDAHGLTFIENEALTPDGLVQKMLTWDKQEDGVIKHVYDATKADMEKVGKKMPKSVRRIEKPKTIGVKEIEAMARGGKPKKVATKKESGIQERKDVLTDKQENKVADLLEEHDARDYEVKAVGNGMAIVVIEGREGKNLEYSLDENGKEFRPVRVQAPSEEKNSKKSDPFNARQKVALNKIQEVLGVKEYSIDEVAQDGSIKISIDASDLMDVKEGDSIAVATIKANGEHSVRVYKKKPGQDDKPKGTAPKKQKMIGISIPYSVLQDNEGLESDLVGMGLENTGAGGGTAEFEGKHSLDALKTFVEKNYGKNVWKKIDSYNLPDDME